MAGYNINDIHKTLSSGLGDDFNLELEEFTGKFAADQTFRAAAFEAMAVIDDRFGEKERNAIDLEAGDPLEIQEMRGQTSSAGLSEGGSLIPSTTGGPRVRNEVCYNERGQVVPCDDPNAMTAREWFDGAAERREIKENREVNFNFWNPILANPTRHNNLISLDLYDFGGILEREQGWNIQLRKKEDYYNRSDDYQETTFTYEVDGKEYEQTIYSVTDTDFHLEHELFDQTTAVRRASEGFNSLLIYGQKKFGIDWAEEWDQLGLFQINIDKAVQTLTLFQEAVEEYTNSDGLNDQKLYAFYSNEDPYIRGTNEQYATFGDFKNNLRNVFDEFNRVSFQQLDEAIVIGNKSAPGTKQPPEGYYYASNVTKNRDGSYTERKPDYKQIAFSGSVNQAIEFYNDLVEGSEFQEYQRFMQWVDKYATAIENLEDENPLYYQALAADIERQKRIDAFQKDPMAYLGVDAFVEATEAGLREVPWVGNTMADVVDASYNTPYVGVKSLVGHQVRATAYGGGKALALVQGGVSLVNSITLTVGDMTGIASENYTSWDRWADKFLDVLDPQQYAGFGTSSNHMGSFYPYAMTTVVDGKTYTVEYEDMQSANKDYTSIRGEDGYMIFDEALSNRIVGTLAGKERKQQFNSGVFWFQTMNTTFDVGTMLVGGAGWAKAGIGLKTAKLTVKTGNRIKRTLGFAEAQLTEKAVKQIAYRQGAELTMAMQMHNGMYQSYLDQGLTPTEAAYHALGGTFAVVTVNRLNPEFNTTYKAWGKVKKGDVNRFIRGSYNTRLQMFRNGASQYGSTFWKAGLMEASEEGIFEPLAQDASSFLLGQAGKGNVDIQSFGPGTVDQMILGGTVGIIFPMVNVVKTNGNLAHMQKDLLFRMHLNPERTRNIINDYVGNKFVDEDGETIREFTQQDADKFIRILETASAQTNAQVNGQSTAFDLNKGESFTDQQIMELHGVNVALAALTEVGSTPQLDPVVNELTENLNDVIKRASEDPSSLNTRNNDPAVPSQEENEAARRVEDELADDLNNLGVPTQSRTAPHIRALAKKLEENFPGTSAVTDQAAFDEVYRNRVMKQFPTLKESNKKEVKGFYDETTNTIFLNPESATLGTAIHEFTHVWLNYVKANNTNLYNKMIELAKNDAGIMGLVPDIAEYTGTDLRAMEAIVHAIENRAELALTAKDSPGLQQLLKMIDELFNYLQKTLNLTDKRFEEYTLGEFIDRGAYEVVTGDMSSGIAVPTVGEMQNQRVVMRDTRGQYAIGDLEVTDGIVGLRQSNGTILKIGGENILYEQANRYGLELLDGTQRRVQPKSENTVTIDGVDSEVSLSMEPTPAPTAEPGIYLAMAADIPMLQSARNSGLLFHGTMEKSLNSFNPQYRAGTYGTGLYFTNAAYKANDYGNYFVFSNPENMNLLPYYDTKFSDLVTLMKDGKFKNDFRFLMNLTAEQAQKIKAIRDEYIYSDVDYRTKMDEFYGANKGLGGAPSAWTTDAAAYYADRLMAGESMAGLSLHDLTMFTYNGTNYGEMNNVRKGLEESGIDGWYVSSDISKYHEAVIINSNKLNESIVDNPFGQTADEYNQAVNTTPRVKRFAVDSKQNLPSVDITNPLGAEAVKKSNLYLSITPSQAAKIGVAPFRSVETLTLEDVNGVHGTLQFQYLSEQTSKLAGLLGIEIGQQSPAHGGYTFMGNEAGRFLQEASQFLEINGDPENIKLFTAVLGAIAPDQQESVVRFTEDTTLDPTADDTNFYMRIPVPGNVLGSDGNEKASEDFRKRMFEAGIQGFSITYGDNLLHLFPENDQEVQDALHFLSGLGAELGTDLQSGAQVIPGKRNFDEETSDQGGYLETIRGFRDANPDLYRTNPELHGLLAFAETSYLREQGFATRNPELISTPLELTWDENTSDFRVGGLPLNDYGKKYGVSNLGKVRETVSVQMAPGVVWNIPGGIEDGVFSFAELFWMKQQGWNPAQITNESNRNKLYRKLGRTMTPEKGDSVSVFNGFIFGLLSPNQPLTPNEFQVAVGRVQAIEHAESDELIRQYFTGEIESLTAEQVPVLTIQGYANMLAGVADPLNMTKEERAALEEKITYFFQAQAADKGGLGIKSSGEYTNLAELAFKFRMDSPIEGQNKGADFFAKSPDETWVSFMTRMMTEVRGLQAKTASFSGVWQDPLVAAISAMDRHMLRVFETELLANSADRAKLESKVIAKWNNAVKARDIYKGKKRTAKDKKEYIDKHDFVTAESVEVTNLDDLMAQRGANQAFMMSMFDLVSQKQAVYEVAKTGQINPRFTEFVGKYNQLLTSPKDGKVSIPGDFYLKALQINNEVATRNGLGIFMSQWALWDKKRNRFEPHEVMFPGLAKLPRLPFFTMQESIKSHKAAGYMNSSMDENMNMSPARPMASSGLYFSIDGDKRFERVVKKALDSGLPPKRVIKKLVDAGMSRQAATNLVMVGGRETATQPKERMTASTWAKAIPDERTTEEITENTKSYFPRSNQMTRAEAKLLIDEIGLPAAIRMLVEPDRVNLLFQDKRVDAPSSAEPIPSRSKQGRQNQSANAQSFRFSAVRVALFNEVNERISDMILELDSNGAVALAENYREALRDMVEQLALDATSAGQFIQAFSLISRAGGETMAAYIKRKLDKKGVPYTEADLEEIKNLAEIMKSYQDNTQEYVKAEFELLKKISKLEGVSLFDIAEAQYYSNMLSGFGTQLKNFAANIASIVTEGIVLPLANLSPMSFFKYWGGVGRSVFPALDQAWFTLKTGIRYERSGSDKFALQSTKVPLYEMYGFNQLWGDDAYTSTADNKVWRAVETILGRTALQIFNPVFMKLPGRMLSAVDIGMRRMSKGGEVSVIMHRLAQGRDTDAMSQEELALLEENALLVVMGDETVEQRQARREKYGTQAVAEGYKPHTNGFRLRIAELEQQDLALNDIEAEAERIATENIFMNEPAGVLGKIYRGMIRALEEDGTGAVTDSAMRIGKALYIPFLKVLANVGNRLYSYTPLQFVNIAGDAVARGLGKPGYQVFRNQDSRRRAYARAVFGTSVMGFFLAGMKSFGDDDDEEKLPAWKITGGGTGDPYKDYQLQMDGRWKPYTITFYRAYPGGPLLDEPKVMEYRETPLSLVFMSLGAITDYEDFKEKGLLDQQTGIDEFMTKATIGVTAFFEGLSDYTFVQGLQELFKGIPSSGSSAGQDGSWQDTYIYKKLEQTMKTLTVPNFVQQLNRSVLDYNNMPLNQRLELLDNWKREMLMFTNETNHPLVDVLGDPVQPDAFRYFPMISEPPQNEVSDYAREYFYETFVMNNCFVPAPTYPGMVVYDSESALYQRAIPMDNIQEYKFYVLRGAKIKDRMLELSESGLLEIAEDAVEDFIDVADDGIVDVNALRDNKKQEVLKKVLNQVVRDASKYATVYLQAEYIVTSLSAKDASTGLTAEEMDYLNAAQEMLNNIGNTSDTWPISLTDRPVNNIFEY
jgi:hypothetical protein